MLPGRSWGYGELLWKSTGFFPQMFSGVQAWALVGPLKDIQKLVKVLKPLQRCLGCIHWGVLKGEPSSQSEVVLWSMLSSRTDLYLAALILSSILTSHPIHAAGKLASLIQLPPCFPLLDSSQVLETSADNHSKLDAPELNSECLTQGSEYLSKRDFSFWFLINLQKWQQTPFSLRHRGLLCANEIHFRFNLCKNVSNVSEYFLNPL